ncbi:MAG: hypothetical protein AAGA85_12250 [Bacteroidota bacterium]
MASRYLSVTQTPGDVVEFSPNTFHKKEISSDDRAADFPTAPFAYAHRTAGTQKPHVGLTYLDYNQFEGTAASYIGAADSTAAARPLYDKLFQPKTTTGHRYYGQDELIVNGQFILFLET